MKKGVGQFSVDIKFLRFQSFTGAKLWESWERIV